MPIPDNLDSIEVGFDLGYFPNAASLAAGRFQRTIRAGDGVWLRPGGKIEVANGLNEVSSTNVGARISAADIQRAVIAGGLTGSRLPYAGLIRIDNSVLLYLSENTSSQVYLDEVAVTGLTTSSTAGRLRVAVPDGSGGYSVFDAGFDKPALALAAVTVFPVSENSILRPMSGQIGVAVAPWRSKTNAIGTPSTVYFSDVPPPGAGGASVIRIDLPTAVSGQDGWIYCGTRWGDQGGEIRVVRYVYIQPRGTFTATNGSASITAGVGTRFLRDIRPADLVDIDGTNYQIGGVTSDTVATLQSNFLGVTGSGKTMTITDVAANWYNSELGSVVSRDILRVPRAAGLLKYGDRVLIWGIPDTTSLTSSSATGNTIAAMLDDNPEHIGLFYIGTASGSDLLNVLATDGPLYLMTTTGLELLTFTNDPQKPYNLRTIAEPGFKASTNGVLHVDYFYGFNGQPFRTRAEENIDVEFAEPVADEMAGWDATRVMLAVDPKKNAVLYLYDDGSATTVRPWMAQLGVWNPPLNFSARIIDTQVVNGTLYVTYLSGGNYRVNEWEGGAGIGGSPYVTSQYYDGTLLTRKRMKWLQVTGKIDTVNVFAAKPGEAVPDVSNVLAAEATFTESDIAEMSEAEQGTNIEARAFAFRVNLTSPDGDLQSLIARGIRKTQLR